MNGQPNWWGKVHAFSSHFQDIVTFPCFILEVLVIWDFSDNDCPLLHNSSLYSIIFPENTVFADQWNTKLLLSTGSELSQLFDRLKKYPRYEITKMTCQQSYMENDWLLWVGQLGILCHINLFDFNRDDLLLHLLVGLLFSFKQSLSCAQVCVTVYVKHGTRRPLTVTII